jgi:hypothetical protein
MSVPTASTLLSLVTEGLRQAGIFNPTPTQLTTYQDEVMEQLKNNLWQSVKQMKPLMTFSYGVLVPGQSRYSCPTDYSSDLSMVILVGLTTGTAVSGTINTLVVPASAGSFGEDQTLGKELLITGGTATPSCSQVISVTGTGPYTLTVYPNFQAAPDGTSTFMLVDNQYPCDPDHIANYDKFRPASLDRPRKFYPVGNEDFDEFIFDVAPDGKQVYGVRMRYYVNIMTLDLTSTLMSTLYLKFRDYWIKGVKAQALADNDDTRAQQGFAERDMKLQELIISQQYGTDLHQLRQHVEDYA